MNKKIKYKGICRGILALLLGSLAAMNWSSLAQAFHPDVYATRVPQEQLEALQEMENPYPANPERIEIGRKIYFGKGLCVTCHSKNGKGVRLPGHSPRNFTDPKWQETRTDGELMWILKNGSPGTECLFVWEK